MAEDNRLDVLSQDIRSVTVLNSPSIPNGKPLGRRPQFNLIENYPQKNAEILSSQYGFNVFLAGLLLMFAWAIHAMGITERDLLSYLITLMLIQLFWMLWYIFRSYCQRRLTKEKDTHAEHAG